MLRFRKGDKEISSLQAVDFEVVEKLLDFVRGRGYVLDFSDRSYSAFFAFELKIDIDSPVYSLNGGSKGKRLKALLQQSDNETAARVLSSLWRRRVQYLLDTASPDPVINAEGKYLRLLENLTNTHAIATGTRPKMPAQTQLDAFRDLASELYSLREKEAHARGYLFEAFLKRCFDLFGLAAREPFRNAGEQIDGSFQLNNDTYLLEAKWTAAPIGNRDLHAFHGKLDSKAAWARGLFVSFSGFTEEGLASFGKGKRVICMDGRDIYESLLQEIPLGAVLERKARYAAETGESFVPVYHLFPNGLA